MENLLEDLQSRGLVHTLTEGVEEALGEGRKLTVYCGFDPTADSLHVGHLVPLIALARFQRAGHSPIALAGGTTAMIGDPSGKTSERQLLDPAQVQANVAAIQNQLARLLDFEVKGNPARLVNNNDWLGTFLLPDFLREVGKHFTINYMMAKDSVKSRLEREGGISYTEFSYMLLQACDYLHLHDHYGCTFQAGGSDQWGNITAGIELVRRVRGQRVYGLAYPLITRADGMKFGKSEDGAVWLDPRRTSPYRFYQFWLNVDDRDVIPYLKYFTWLSATEIAEMHESLASRPEQREAHRRLAREMTEMIHGPTALCNAEQAAQALFGGDVRGLGAAEIEEIFAEVPSSEASAASFEGTGQPLADLLAATSLASSKGDARRSIQGGGIYINNEKVADPGRSITPEDCLEGRYIILRKGRKNYHLVRVAG